APASVRHLVECSPIGDVDDLQCGLARDATSVSGGEVVNDEHAPVVGEKRVHDVRADEARAAGDDRVPLRQRLPPSGSLGPTGYRPNRSMRTTGTPRAALQSSWPVRVRKSTR